MNFCIKFVEGQSLWTRSSLGYLHWTTLIFERQHKKQTRLFLAVVCLLVQTTSSVRVTNSVQMIRSRPRTSLVPAHFLVIRSCSASPRNLVPKRSLPHPSLFRDLTSSAPGKMLIMLLHRMFHAFSFWPKGLDVLPMPSLSASMACLLAALHPRRLTPHMLSLPTEITVCSLPTCRRATSVRGMK